MLGKVRGDDRGLSAGHSVPCVRQSPANQGPLTECPVCEVSRVERVDGDGSAAVAPVDAVLTCNPADPFDLGKGRNHFVVDGGLNEAGANVRRTHRQVSAQDAWHRLRHRLLEAVGQHGEPQHRPKPDAQGGNGERRTPWARNECGKSKSSDPPREPAGDGQKRRHDEVEQRPGDQCGGHDEEGTRGKSPGRGTGQCHRHRTGGAHHADATDDPRYGLGRTPLFRPRAAQGLGDGHTRCAPGGEDGGDEGRADSQARGKRG